MSCALSGAFPLGQPMPSRDFRARCNLGGMSSTKKLRPSLPHAKLTRTDFRCKLDLNNTVYAQTNAGAFISYGA